MGNKKKVGTIHINCDESFVYSCSCDLQWSHEPDIQEFVKHALFDILHMYDIPVSLVREVSVTQIQPDFWIVKFLGTPIGII